MSNQSEAIKNYCRALVKYEACPASPSLAKDLKDAGYDLDLAFAQSYEEAVRMSDIAQQERIREKEDLAYSKALKYCRQAD